MRATYLGALPETAMPACITESSPKPWRKKSACARKASAVAVQRGRDSEIVLS